MPGTLQLSNDMHKLGLKFGATLLKMKGRFAEGMKENSAEAEQLTRETIALHATMQGIHFTAKACLDEDEFNQFLYRTGIPLEEAEEALKRVQALIN